MPNWERVHDKLAFFPLKERAGQVQMSNDCDKKSPEEVWCFAYGSNLYIPQMMTRVGEWTASRKAHLTGWKLIFNVDSKRWGGGAANIIKTNNEDDIVYGAIYLLSCQKLRVLTGYEREPPQDIEVESEGKPIKAKTYIFCENKPALKPTCLYVHTITGGLRQHGHGEDAIKAVESARIIDEESRIIEKKIILGEGIWSESRRRFGDKWQEHIDDLIEKDLFGRSWEKLLKGKIEKQ